MHDHIVWKTWGWQERQELTYNCLETRVKLCQERWFILQCQDSFFNHCTFNIIILNHHIFFQYFDCIELLRPLPVRQHHLHEEKQQGENLPIWQGGKGSRTPEELYRWQSGISFYWYRLTWSKLHKYPPYSPTAVRCTSHFSQSLCQNPLVNRRHVARGLIKCWIPGGFFSKGHFIIQVVVQRDRKIAALSFD